MKISASLFLLVILNAACSNGEREISTRTKQDFTQRVTIVSAAVTQYELDSVTAPMINCLQYYTDEKTEQLIYLNPEVGRLYFNDVASKRIVKSIKINTEFSTKKKYIGFYYHRKDSIFLFSPKQVSLMNQHGEIKTEYKLTKGAEQNIYYYGINSSTVSQIYLYKNKLHISPVVLGGNNKQKIIQVILNLETGKPILGKNLSPAFYTKYKFGNSAYDMYSTGVNPVTHSIIYSFPAYEKLIVHNVETQKTDEVIATSKFVTNFTQYFEDDYKEAPSNPKLEYFMTTNTYGGIFYDKYRDLYYRLALLPVNKKNANYESKNKPVKQLSVVVFDKNFKYLGEQKLDRNKYLMFSAFVSKDGFNIQNNTKSDKTLDFTLFTVAKKNLMADNN